MRAALILLTLIFSAPASRGDAKLTAPRFSSCAGTRCVKVQSETAFEGHLSRGHLFFTAGTLTLVENEKAKVMSFQEGYLDQSQQRIYLRKLANPASKALKDGYYELKTGELVLLF